MLKYLRSPGTPRIGVSALAAVLMSLSAGAAMAHEPEQVQYLPRNESAIVLWKAGEGAIEGYNVYQQIVQTPGAKPTDPVKVNKELIKPSTTSFLVENLQNGTAYHFRVSAIEGGVESEKVAPFPAQGDQGQYVSVVPQKDVTVAGKAGFVGFNIGTDYPGSHEVAADGTITMKASGWDIQSDADGFYYLAIPMSGDVTVTARCVSGPTATSDGNEWNLAGPMIRESLDSRARLTMTQVARKGNLQFKRRTGFAESPPDTQTDAIAADKRPVWLRLVRKGNDFSGFVSEDGSNWIQVGETEKIDDFAKEPWVGLAACAHQDKEYSTVVFDRVTITSP